MSHDAHDTSRSIVPPEELRCVWMTAGILSYQLCEREYDCDRCPLDAALRMHFARPRAAAAGAVADRRRRGLEADRYYGRRHCWVKPGGEAGPGATRMRIGLEPGLAGVLPVPRAIASPNSGEPMQEGEVHLWIVTRDGVFPLAAPLSGVLCRTNPELNQRPHLLASRPLDQGWLYEMEVEAQPPGLSALMDAEEASRAYEADARRFRGALRRALQAEGGAAPALADGGAPLGDVSDMLGPARYLALLRAVFG